METKKTLADSLDKDARNILDLGGGTGLELFHLFEIYPDVKEFLDEACPEMMAQAHGPENSLLPYFQGYKYENGVSTYKGEEVGEGGYVYAEPGIHKNVALLDIASNMMWWKAANKE